MSSLSDFNVDLTIEYVKNIYENILCALCDKPDLPRMRYPCGHSLCENCINTSVGCYICLTPPESTTSAKPEYDAVLTQQVQNVSHLINVLKETFNIDVYKRKRESENLKIEKELFPQCIQAPLKYYNKRKSSNTFNRDKENYHSKFLGEDISPVKINKMENSVNYVQNWLNKNDSNRKRKPLADINLDNANIKRKSGTLNPKVNSSLNIKSYENKQKKLRKRPFKTSNSLMESQNTLDKFLRDTKIKQNIKDISMKKANESNKTKISNAEDTYESGIVIDDDTSILIEDSQLSIDYDKTLSNRMVDKDKNALLQVVEASKNEQDFLENRTISSKVEIQQTEELYQQYKVPFYKMSYLRENCYLCTKDICVQNIAKYESQSISKDIHVTIDNNNFTATIKVTNNVQNIKRNVKKVSVPVQTDIVDINYSYNHYDKKLESNTLKSINLFNKPALVTKSIDVKSQELFMSEIAEEIPDNIDKNILNDPNTEFKKRKNVIIEESDSSDDMEESRVVEVTADIHRSCEQLEYDILSKIENIEEHEHRPRRRPRGHTPDSSNSSDKENFDPNRFKKLKTSKKVCYKK